MLSLHAHTNTAQHQLAQTRSISTGDTVHTVGAPQSVKLNANTSSLGGSALNSEMGSLKALVDKSAKESFNYLA
jgi:hypothetical protein